MKLTLTILASRIASSLEGRINRAITKLPRRASLGLWSPSSKSSITRMPSQVEVKGIRLKANSRTCWNCSKCRCKSTAATSRTTPIYLGHLIIWPPLIKHPIRSIWFWVLIPRTATSQIQISTILQCEASRAKTVEELKELTPIEVNNWACNKRVPICNQIWAMYKTHMLTSTCINSSRASTLPVAQAATQCRLAWEPWIKWSESISLILS